MINISEVFTNIFIQNWYIFILIGIVLFIKEKIKTDRKNAFSKNRRKRQKVFHLNNKEKGDELELRTGKYYERLGHEVIYHGLKKGLKDGGIDLICKNGKFITLIQCKNYNTINSVTHEDLKVFHSNATKYIEENHIDKNNTQLKYIVPNKNVFDKSALKIFEDNYYRCNYLIL